MAILARRTIQRDQQSAAGSHHGGPETRIVRLRLHTERSRCDSDNPSKRGRKVTRRGKSQPRAYFRDGHRGALEKCLCFFDSLLQHVSLRCNSHALLEFPTEIVAAYSRHLRNPCKAQVVLNVIRNEFDDLLQPAGRHAVLLNRYIDRLRIASYQMCAKLIQKASRKGQIDGSRSSEFGCEPRQDLSYQ